MPKSKSKKPIQFTAQDINAKVEEYDVLRAQKKTIDDRMKTLAGEIKDYATAHGEQDNKGSYYCDSEQFQYGSQAKKSVTFNTDKALQFLKDRGLTDAIRTVETLDEDAISRYVEDGTLTFDDIESITTTKVSYSVDVKRKEALPVVEQTTVPLAASKKPTTKPKLTARRGK